MIPPAKPRPLAMPTSRSPARWALLAAVWIVGIAMWLVYLVAVWVLLHFV
jgi:hypothetical protein